MANRIGARLAAWVRLQDTSLRTTSSTSARANDPLTRERARRLFAQGARRARAACASRPSTASPRRCSRPSRRKRGSSPGLPAARGPGRAGAGPDDARRACSPMPRAAGNERLIGDVQCLSLRLGEEGAVDYLMRCARAPEALAAFGDAAKRSKPSIRAVMEPARGLGRGLSRRPLRRRPLRLRPAAGDRRRQPRAGARTTGTEHRRQRRALAGADRRRARGAACPSSRWSCSPSDGELRKVTAGQRKADPDYDAHAERLAAAIGELLRIQNGAAPRRRHGGRASRRAGVRRRLHPRQAQRRRRRLRRPDRLDPAACSRSRGWANGCATSSTARPTISWSTKRRTPTAAQWEIVQALAEEYFSGSSEAERRHRTLFMVGDFKQAIFGFQGTDPQRISTSAREWAREQCRGACATAEDEADDGQRRALEFRDLSIDASFRSAPAMLDVVDAVIDEVGLSRDGACPSRPTAHRAHFERPARAWSSCGSRSRSRRGEERRGRGGLARRARPRLCGRARRADPALARRSAGARLDRAAAVRPATS